MAYITIDKTGYVDGICFSSDPKALEWLTQQENAGYQVQYVTKEYGKSVLFTTLTTWITA